MLFDAIEGFHNTPELDLKSINTLKQRIENKSEKSKRVLFPILIRAAAVMVILVAFVFVMQHFMNENEDSSPELVEVVNEETKGDFAIEPVTNDETKDTALLALNEMKKEAQSSDSESMESKRETASISKSNPPKDKPGVQFKTFQNSAVEYDSSSKEKVIADVEQKESVEPEISKENQSGGYTKPAAGASEAEALDMLELADSGIANIFGQITDLETGEPLIGANIQIRGTDINAISDVDGKYQIAVPFTNPHLQFSYVGYETKEFNLQGDNEVNIALNSSSALLDEVVVSKYGNRIKHTDDGEVTVEPSMGWTQLERFIENNLENYREDTDPYTQARTQKYIGSVELEFMVTKVGSLKDFKVLNSTCKECEEKAIELLRKSGRWHTDPEATEVMTTITILF